MQQHEKFILLINLLLEQSKRKNITKNRGN